MEVEWWVSRDSNPGPTPKAFGAALFIIRIRFLYKMVGQPGLEPGTNPEGFRGCSVYNSNI